MTYRITGLDRTAFEPYFDLADAALANKGARRVVVDAKPGFPDRIEVRDLEIGETALLVNYEHQPADSPFRASHAIFVGLSSRTRLDLVDAVPEALRLRPISLRAFGDDGMMIDADLADGDDVEPAIVRMLADPRVAYLHAHYAKPGCYAARIDRA